MQLLLKIGYLIIFIIQFGIIPSQGQNSSKPNIIYIYADDLGYGELGVYGQQKIRKNRVRN